jgi:creatinine amidohydrolase
MLAWAVLSAATAGAQDLPFRWDELTAADWPRAMERSEATVILPFGILEKHGPHAPIGFDRVDGLGR